MSEIIEVEDWRPDYTRKCEVCGAGHVVTGWKGGKEVYSGDMCGVCSWGEAAMRDPANW